MAPWVSIADLSSVAARDWQLATVEPKALTKILHSESGANTLISLKISGAKGATRVLVKDYQLDPITHRILNADFYQIAMDKVLRVKVPQARGLEEP